MVRDVMVRTKRCKIVVADSALNGMVHPTLVDDEDVGTSVAKPTHDLPRDKVRYLLSRDTHQYLHENYCIRLKKNRAGSYRSRPYEGNQ